VLVLPLLTSTADRPERPVPARRPKALLPAVRKDSLPGRGAAQPKEAPRLAILLRRTERLNPADAYVVGTQRIRARHKWNSGRFFTEQQSRWRQADRQTARGGGAVSGHSGRSTDCTTTAQAISEWSMAVHVEVENGGQMQLIGHDSECFAQHTGRFAGAPPG
jgi:hypothetical protein